MNAKRQEAHWSHREFRDRLMVVQKLRDRRHHSVEPFTTFKIIPSLQALVQSVLRRRSARRTAKDQLNVWKNNARVCSKKFQENS